MFQEINYIIDYLTLSWGNTHAIRNVTISKLRSRKTFFDPAKWCSLWSAWISAKIVIFPIFWHLFTKHFVPWSTSSNTKPWMGFCLSYITSVVCSLWIWSLSSFNFLKSSNRCSIMRAPLYNRNRNRAPLYKRNWNFPYPNSLKR